jgi:hypothetical protein
MSSCLASTKRTMLQQYVAIDPTQGYPTGDNLYYECQLCHEAVPSLPKDKSHCECYNVRIDMDAGRIAVNDLTKVKLLQISPDSSGTATKD